MLYGIPVAELQQRIDSHHFAELMAYDRTDCLPDSWHQSATIAQQVYHSMAGKGAQTLTVDKWIPTKAEALTADQQMALLRSSTGAG